MLGRAGPRGRGESSTGAPDATPEESGTHARGGYLTARHPTRCGWRLPTRETRTPFPEDEGAGRVPGRTSADGPTVDNADDDGRPLSLFPSRVPRNARRASSSTARTDPPPRQTRPPPPKEGPPAATGPDASGDAPETTDRRFSKGRARERGHEPATPEPDSPAPRRVGSPLLPDRGNAAGVRGSEATSTRHAVTNTRTRRARRGPRTRERQRRGRAGGTARGGHGRWTGGAREPTATQPRYSLCSAPRGVRTTLGECVWGGTRVPAALGRARNAGPFVRSPTTGVTTSQAPARQRRRHDTLSFAPRGSSPDSERGGAGRSGHKTRSGFPPQKSGRGEGNPAKATRIGRSQGGLGRPRRVQRERDPKHVPFTGSLEKALFSLRAGGTDPARRAPGRGSRPRAGMNTAR